MKLLFPFSLLAAALLTLLLAGCQSTPPAPQGSFPTDASQLTRWQIKGRIGYDNGKNGGSAHLLWQQTNPEQGRLELSGPLGFGGGVITYTAQGATLDTGKQIVSAPNATDLAWRVTGLALPIAALGWWVRALPWPDAVVSNRQLNSHGQLANLDQAGWQLSFDRYQDYHGLMLPGRIKARQGDDRFTLLIADWALPPTTSP